MLNQIPTHLIAGSLGAGKTSLLEHLLGQRPSTERWAVLINEFGQVGLDAALLSTPKLSTLNEEVAISEVAGGCVCCVNGAPFEIGLGRLLRQARPDRLFIETSGLGHPDRLRRQLQRAPWEGVLDLQPLILVLDAMSLARGDALSEPVRQVVDKAGLIVINKSLDVEPSALMSIEAKFAGLSISTVQGGQLPYDQLPVNRSVAGKLQTASIKGSLAFPRADAAEAEVRISCTEHAEGWSIGWQWRADQRFDTAAVDRWLKAWPWRRAKLIIHSEAGWRSTNLVQGRDALWKASEWRKDSRIELIFAGKEDQQALSAGLYECRATASSACAPDATGSSR